MKKSDITSWINNGYPSNRLSDDAVQGLHLKKNPSSMSWRLLYRDVLGKQRNIVLGRYPSMTLDEARKRGKELYAEIIRGNDPLKQRNEEKAKVTNTVKGYLDAVYTGILETKKSGKETRQIFDRHFSHLFNKVMSELNAKDVTAWQAKMIENGKAYATQQRAYGALKTLLNDAVKRGVLTDNPLAKVTLDKIHESEEVHLERKSKRCYLTKEQVHQLFDGLDKYQKQKRQGRRNSRSHGKAYLPCLDNLEFVDYVKPFILTMFYTGFRNGDVYGLRWEHIHFYEGLATIHKTIEKTAHKKPEAKTFPIADELAAILQSWGVQNGNPKSGYVFSNAEGGRLGGTALKKPWKKIKELADLPQSLDLYTLRHNFASWLVMNGSDLLTVAKLMGHSDIRMIIDHYGHLQPATLEKAVSESFAKMFS
jgi:integrase